MKKKKKKKKKLLLEIQIYSASDIHYALQLDKKKIQQFQLNMALFLGKNNTIF
jgi:hypothetical protein